MTRFVACGLSVLLCGSLLAFGDASASRDARALLTESQGRIRATKAVRYQSRTTSQGVLAQRFPTMSSKVTMQRSPAGQGSLYAEVEVTPKDATPPYRVEMVSDAGRIVVVNHTQRTYDDKPYAEGVTYLKNTMSTRIDDFIAAEPYVEDLRSGTLTYVGTAAVDDVTCHIIETSFAGRPGKFRWFIGKDDLLPRGYDIVSLTPVGDSTIQLRLSGLEVDPELPEKRFALFAPDGYRKLESAPPPPPVANGKRFLEPGTPAPDFTLKTADGKDVALKDLRGKVVLLDFWATWCGPCRMVMPRIQKLYEKYQDKPVAVFGVSTWERGPSPDPGGYMKRNKYTYPTLVNGDAVASAYMVNGIPTFYLIGPDGNILMAFSGVSEEQERQLEARIDAVLKELAAGPQAAGRQP